MRCRRHGRLERRLVKPLARSASTLAATSSPAPSPSIIALVLLLLGARTDCSKGRRNHPFVSFCHSARSAAPGEPEVGWRTPACLSQGSCFCPPRQQLLQGCGVLCWRGRGRKAAASEMVDLSAAVALAARNVKAVEGKVARGGAGSNAQAAQAPAPAPSAARRSVVLEGAAVAAAARTPLGAHAAHTAPRDDPLRPYTEQPSPLTAELDAGGAEGTRETCPFPPCSAASDGAPLNDPTSAIKSVALSVLSSSLGLLTVKPTLPRRTGPKGWCGACARTTRCCSLALARAPRCPRWRARRQRWRSWRRRRCARGTRRLWCSRARAPRGGWQCASRARTTGSLHGAASRPASTTSSRVASGHSSRRPSLPRTKRARQSRTWCRSSGSIAAGAAGAGSCTWASPAA